MQGFSHFFETQDVTFSVHHELNPKIWSGNLIKTDVKEKLLKMPEHGNNLQKYQIKQLKMLFLLEEMRIIIILLIQI